MSRGLGDVYKRQHKFSPESISNSVMEVDKVVIVQVEDISIVKVQVAILKRVSDQLLLIGFLGGLVDC